MLYLKHYFRFWREGTSGEVVESVIHDESMASVLPLSILQYNGKIRQVHTSDESNLNRGLQSMDWEETKLGFMLPFWMHSYGTGISPVH